MRQNGSLFILSLLSLGLTGCEVGPDYKPPAVETPVSYKEIGKWQEAVPEDAIDRGAWWKIFEDPVLDELEKQIDISNQTLKAAEAAYRQERAIVEEARAGYFPTVSATGGLTRTGAGTGPGGALTDASGITTTTTGKGAALNSYNLSIGASWVPDLWGRISRTVESDLATAEASEADLALARLSAEANLATDYFSLRAQDELEHLLEVTVVNDKRSFDIVNNQYKEGVAAKADVLTAQTQLESVQASEINANVQRSLLEHAIAILVGKPPAEVAIAAAPLAKVVPSVPTGVPSTLLERRPDIAAAERSMAAASASIGVAVAAYYPDLTLSASYGYSSIELGKLISSPNSLWTLGPTLADTLFDAGLREAQVEAAHAGYEQTVANYRQTVLTGFQQVEDDLASLHYLSQQSSVETSVVADARSAEKLVLNQYKAGIVPYSSVIAAENTTLINVETELTVRQNLFAASIGLIQALGGGLDSAGHDP